MKSKTKTVVQKKSADNSGKKILVKQLTGLLKDIDDDGILFLIKQAQVLIYNKKVENHNSKIKKGVKISAKKPAFSDKGSMEIKEADDGSSFIFVINKSRKFFTLQEMRIIVNICHISGNGKEGSRKLFTWFKKNRSDVLNDVGIETSVDPALETMYNFLIKRYKVKDRNK